MTTKRALFCDPELPTGELESVIEHARRSRLPVVVFHNPLQAELLSSAGLAVIGETRPFGALRDAFDAIHREIVEVRRAGAARFRLESLREHEVDMAAMLEAGHGTEEHVAFASLLEAVDLEEVEIAASRETFRQVALTYAERRGWRATEGWQSDDQAKRTKSGLAARGPKTNSADLLRVARELGRWTAPGRLRVYGNNHRQVSPLLHRLAKEPQIAVGTPTLSRAFGVGLRRVVVPSERDRESARRALRTLREHGSGRFRGWVAVAWHTMLDGFERRLDAHLSTVAAELAALDFLSPNVIVAPTWLGVDAHAMRAWARNSGVPFCVVQHGYNLGARDSSRTYSVDADVFYAWSQKFVDDWVDLAASPDTVFVPAGNPAYDSVVPRRLGEPRSVMFAPTGTHGFGRESLFDFWRAAFDFVARSQDRQLRWKVRPHLFGRIESWIREQSDALGCAWSRTSEPSFEQAVADVDIVVTTVSSAAVDSMVRGVLTVVLNATDEPAHFLPNTAAAYRGDSRDLGAILKTLLDSPDARGTALDRQRTVVEEYASDDIIERICEDVAARASLTRR